MTYAKLHENLPDGWWTQTNIAREDFRELPITSSTVAVKLGPNGVIIVTHISSLRSLVMQHISVLKPLHANIINLIAQYGKVVMSVNVVHELFAAVVPTAFCSKYAGFGNNSVALVRERTIPTE
jgi:hypothetical protein